ncbi:MAG: protein translocase subunit SecF [Christensenellales bacterium]
MRFIKNAKYTSLFMLLIVIIAVIIGLFSNGLNLGIDFTGGSIFTVEMNKEYDIDDVNAALEANGINPATVQIVRSEGTKADIRMQELPEGADGAALREAVVNTLEEKYPGVKSGDIESVGGATTKDIIANAFLSVIAASAMMLIYIWIRFELLSGIAAVAALLHDVLIMTAAVCILRIQINSSYIAACLTIVGYSINDTIVIFDRIRENNKKLASAMSREDIADLSIRETLSRTINTSLTTIIMVVAIYIFGVSSIKEFALPIIIGLVAGTYSSIYIAPAIWIKLLNRKQSSKSGSRQKKASNRA